MNRKVKVILFDTAGVLLMIAALLTGWLPGPGGIPLFIIGLSLLAVHHEWAQRYIDLLRKYADRLGDIIFIKDPRMQLAYDCLATLVVAGGVYMVAWQTMWWARGLGVGMVLLGVVVLLGNRDRYAGLKSKITGKRKK